MRLVRSWLPAVLWTALILSASNDSFSSAESQGWLETLVGDSIPYAINVAVRKCGHLVAYAVLAALAWRADRRVSVAISVALLVAVIDEVRQSTMIYRTGNPWDVLLDFCGGWLGIAAGRRVWKPRGE